MKQCTKCLQIRDVSCFYKRHGRSYDHQHCKFCLKDALMVRQRRIKSECVLYKGGRCADCDITGHPAIFDFHHMDPAQKDFGISRFKNSALNDTIKKELDKCLLVCANCHRLRHAKY